MSKHTKKLPQPAEKTIEVVLDEFLEEQRKRLKPSTMRKYEDIIDLFQSCLDGYAYQSLNKQENALFDRHTRPLKLGRAKNAVDEESTLR